MDNVVRMPARPKPETDDLDLESLRLVEPPRPMETPPDQKPERHTRNRPQRETEPFAHIPVRDIRRGVEACGGQQLAVWLYICQQAKLHSSRTVPVKSQTLALWGVGPDAKGRALRSLEAAGLVSVEWRLRHNPIVTVLGADPAP
jgi:hypothetical protein